MSTSINKFMFGADGADAQFFSFLIRRLRSS